MAEEIVILTEEQSEEVARWLQTFLLIFLKWEKLSMHGREFNLGNTKCTFHEAPRGKPYAADMFEFACQRFDQRYKVLVICNQRVGKASISIYELRSDSSTHGILRLYISTEKANPDSYKVENMDAVPVSIEVRTLLHGMLERL